ncbi:hypothetical protein Ddye_028341 [Dipteronia dyeriana]|uniref:Kinesin motor domain-containing protein n=1 Tax=Dipteronia dyeriana TaxID=168575 RepID=A0AAD9WRB2_9ROSI|nr:hypothetical protein Ddye_028341 [Dipteronia dyeriana]
MIIWEDEKEEDFSLSFHRVFYEKSKQVEVYKFLALPIVRDAVDTINGTIITYGQVKLYSLRKAECKEYCYLE